MSRFNLDVGKEDALCHFCVHGLVEGLTMNSSICKVPAR